MEQSLIRLPRVKTKTAVPRSSIYDLMAQGKFPLPVPIGVRRVAWIESEIDEWIAKQIQQRKPRARFKAKPSPQPLKVKRVKP